MFLIASAVVSFLGNHIDKNMVRTCFVYIQWRWSNLVGEVAMMQGFRRCSFSRLPFTSSSWLPKLPNPLRQRVSRLAKDLSARICYAKILLPTWIPFRSGDPLQGSLLSFLGKIMIKWCKDVYLFELVRAFEKWRNAWMSGWSRYLQARASLSHVCCARARFHF